MKKLLISLVFIIGSIGLNAQTDSRITSDQYFNHYFPIGRDNYFKYINVHYTKNGKIIKSYSYFKCKGKYKLAMFDSVYFKKEITFSRDELFDYVESNMKYLNELLHTKKYFEIGGTKANTAEQYTNVAIRCSNLHCNHFYFSDEMSVESISEDDAKTGCRTINSIVNFILQKFE